MAELIHDGVTGYHFEAGSASDLAAKVRQAWDAPDNMLAMGEAARAEFDMKYTADRNYDLLMAIYQNVLKSPPVSMNPIRATPRSTISPAPSSTAAHRSPGSP